MPEKIIRNIGLFKKVALLIGLLVILFLILKQSHYLRSVGYDQIPDAYVILDEHTNIWHGLSIRKSGVPAAWSNINAYKNGSGGDVNGLNLSVADYKLPTLINYGEFPKPVYVLHPVYIGTGKTLKKVGFVQPYLDHPPLGALILSSFVNRDIKTFSDLLPTDLRRASLWLGALTGALIFLLGWQVSKFFFVGLLSAAIYGSVPTYSLLSRYALLENVLNPLMLIVLNLLVFLKLIIEKHNKKVVLINGLLISAGIFSGLTALTKIIGWFMLPAGILLLLFWKVTFKRILLFAIPATIIGSLYFAWGLYLDPKLFLDIVFYQGIDRGFVGSLNFLTTLSGVGIVNFPFDGWWMGGFLALLMISFKKEYAPIIFTAITYLIMTLFLGGANYPWYYMPLIPLMCVATSLLIWKVATQPNFILIITFFLVFFSSSFYWGYGVFQAEKQLTNYTQPYQVYRLLLIIFLSAGVWLSIRRRFEINNISLKIWFVFMLLVIYQLWKWNSQSILFILSHWGKYPSLYTPGTF